MGLRNWFKREPLISCGEARERMLSAPLIKWHLKEIDKRIRIASKNGCEMMTYGINIKDELVVDDVEKAVKNRGYTVKSTPYN